MKVGGFFFESRGKRISDSFTPEDTAYFSKCKALNYNIWNTYSIVDFCTNPRPTEMESPRVGSGLLYFKSAPSKILILTNIWEPLIYNLLECQSTGFASLILWKIWHWLEWEVHTFLLSQRDHRILTLISLNYKFTFFPFFPRKTLFAFPPSIFSQFPCWIYRFSHKQVCFFVSADSDLIYSPT